MCVNTSSSPQRQTLSNSYTRVKGFANMMFGGTWFFIDKFRCATTDGILWMHGYGNVFEKVLGPGEQIDVEPGGWLYKDASVTMETNIQSLSTGLLASMNIITNRFTARVASRCSLCICTTLPGNRRIIRYFLY